MYVGPTNATWNKSQLDIYVRISVQMSVFDDAYLLYSLHPMPHWQFTFTITKLLKNYLQLYMYTIQFTSGLPDKNYGPDLSCQPLDPI